VSRKIELSIREAINLHCMECGYFDEGRGCDCPDCFLYPITKKRPDKWRDTFFEADGSRINVPFSVRLRQGHKMTPEQRQAATDRLRKAREAREGQ
jgi:hypothetical protein